MVSKYEILAKKELETEGWIVDDKRGMSRWSKNRDFFNRWDLVAVKKGEPLRYISIKGTQGLIHSHIDELKAFWLPSCCQKELWCWSKRKRDNGWNKIVITDEKN